MQEIVSRAVQRNAGEIIRDQTLLACLLVLAESKKADFGQANEQKMTLLACMLVNCLDLMEA